MTKKEIIDKLAAEGKGSKTELRKKSVEELKAMIEVEPVSEDKAGDTPSPQKEETPKEEVFHTFCGSPFDPSHNSDCHVECQQATPEHYNRCVEHFKAKAVAPKKAKSTRKGKRGSNRWGHLIDSQAEMIDRALLTAEGPMKLEAIAEFASARKPRTRHHLMHLINEWKVDLRIDGEKGIFLAEKFEDLCDAEGVTEFK